MTDETKLSAALLAVFFVGVALICIGGGLFSARFAAIFTGVTLTAGAIKLLVALISQRK